ncbi:uncharacterized protein LOC110704586 [Chenopodium quinoa]|uniref:uncharacterized protein LOC110704586 n=1 Tax=Chenopodium quinoa TaxID=63459 RepID=UPI000B791DC6|nr:uncharacterized protein LOC110704586 [Chenopodium quinoa]
MKVVALMIVLLSIQFMPSFTQEGPTPSPEVLPPAPTPLGLGGCWDSISNCWIDHINNSQSLPQYDPLSASFNETDYACCSLIQETASTEKPCFCSISSYLNQSPAVSTNFVQILTTCGIATSIPALDDFCLGSSESPTALSPNGNTAETGASNKIEMVGPLSGLLVLLTCVLF